MTAFVDVMIQCDLPVSFFERVFQMEQWKALFERVSQTDRWMDYPEVFRRVRKLCQKAARQRETSQEDELPQKRQKISEERM